jgi:uncharacterized protein (TIGR02246 family)
MNIINLHKPNLQMETATNKNIGDNIRSVYKALLENWNRNDAAGFSNLFTESASVVGFDGSEMNGKTQIQEELTKIFHDHKVSTYVGIIKEIRPLAEHIYLLRSVAGMLPPGKTEIKPGVNAIQTLIIIEIDGNLRIELYQNTPAAFHGRPELSQQLTAELQQVADRHLTIV